MVQMGSFHDLGLAMGGLDRIDLTLQFGDNSSEPKPRAPGSTPPANHSGHSFQMGGGFYPSGQQMG